MATATRTVSIASAVGLHARPASILVQKASASGQTVTLTTKDGNEVDASSILGVLSLGVGHGDEVTIKVEGDNAETVADEIQELLNTDLDAQ